MGEAPSPSPSPETVELRAALARADERMAALDEASRAIAGLLEVDVVLQTIVDRVCDLVGAEYAALGTVDEHGEITRFITAGMSRQQRLRIGSIPRGRGLLGLIIREGRSYRIREIAAHPDTAGFPPEHPPMSSFLGVPVVVKGRSVGNLYLTNKRDAMEFTADDQRLVEMFALHAGIAFENAQLHDQVRRLAVVTERERIGKDLHDGVIQSIYAVALSLEDLPDLLAEDAVDGAARVDRAIDALNLTIRDIRNFIFGLRPELLDEAGLVAGLATLTDEFRLNTLIDAEFSADHGLVDEPSLRVRSEVLQIAREALSNVARHSGSGTMRMHLDVEEDALILSISDHGRGFDPSAGPRSGHLGLANMLGRARDLGGSLEIDSVPGTGTTVTARIPSPGARGPLRGPRAGVGSGRMTPRPD